MILRRRRRSTESELAAWRDATNETTTWTLWSSAVELAAVRKGASGDLLRRSPRIRRILHRAFNAGEPVWMAADEVAFVAKAIVKNLPSSAREEHRRIMAANDRAHAAIKRSPEGRGGSLGTGGSGWTAIEGWRVEYADVTTGTPIVSTVTSHAELRRLIESLDVYGQWYHVHEIPKRKAGARSPDRRRPRRRSRTRGAA